MLVMFGPPNAPPLESRWMFEWNLYCTDKHEINDGKVHREEQQIGRHARALLWYAGRPFDKYKGCVVQQKCRFAPELEPLSVVFRVDPKDTEPNALLWIRKCRAPRRRRDLSYLKVARNHFYHLNVTFANGEIVHRFVHQLGWRFTLFLLTKKQKHGADEITLTRQFTNFSTAWVNGNEPAPDGTELEMANAAREIDAEEDKEDQLAPMSTSTESASAVSGHRHGVGVMLGVGPTKEPKEKDAKSITGECKGYAMGMTRPYQPTAAVPGMVTSTNTDHFSPMTPVPSQPSAQVMTELLRGGQAVPRNEPPASNRPTKQASECTWHGDVMVLLSKSVDFDVPLISELPADLPFKLDAVVENFVPFTPGDGSLADTLGQVERTIRTYARDLSSSIVDHAKVYMNTLSAVAQLPGWQHVQDYIIDPLAYIERSYPVKSNASTTEKITINPPPQPLSMGRLLREDNIQPLQEQGKLLLTQLCVRVRWLLALRNAAAQKTEQEVALRATVFYLCSDRKWVSDAQIFMRDAELRVTQMLTRNATRFAQFRELQKKGVAWPHSIEARHAIERAGFTFRPMMIKRDRVVCDDCLREVSGFRAYHNPSLFHDFSRHDPNFRPLPPS